MATRFELVLDGDDDVALRAVGEEALEAIAETERRLSFFDPGSLVTAVCETPFGAHPQNMIAQNLPEFDGYELDREFLTDFRAAAESPESFEQWIEQWVLGCEDHEAYLAKVRTTTVDRLDDRSCPYPPHGSHDS